MFSRLFYIAVLVCALSVLTISGSCKSPGKKTVVIKTVENDPFPDIHEYPVPETIRLCGETIDLTNPRNAEMFDREFTISVWDRPQVFMWLKRTTRFFPYFEDKLEEAGLPDDLKYLAVAESSLHTHIRSRAGALGIWQLMPETAKRYGLRVERGVIDERLCFINSTEAAFKYLTRLRETFDDWMLVMAAYNCGENKLNKAVKNQSEDDYFNLDLPRETERYIFRIAAIKQILENYEKYGYQIDKQRMYDPVKHVGVSVDVNKRYYIADLVSLMGIGYKEFTDLNPSFLSPILPLGEYRVNIPPGHKKSLLLSLKKLNDPAYRKKHKLSSRYYVVQPGDALYSISWETGISVARLKKLNRIRGSVIRPGQKLILRK